MSQRSEKIKALVESFGGRDLDRHYLAFFGCFNQELFFEAHEVLETLWLEERGGPKANFYKALIQLAGALVHLQKQRPKPAIALFRLAQRNLSAYPAVYERLEVERVRGRIAQWLREVESHGALRGAPPKLDLPVVLP